MVAEKIIQGEKKIKKYPGNYFTDEFYSALSFQSHKFKDRFQCWHHQHLLQVSSGLKVLKFWCNVLSSQ